VQEITEEEEGMILKLENPPQVKGEEEKIRGDGEETQ
jgi:hypothetical protein